MSNRFEGKQLKKLHNSIVFNEYTSTKDLQSPNVSSINHSFTEKFNSSMVNIKTKIREIQYMVKQKAKTKQPFSEQKSKLSLQYKNISSSKKHQLSHDKPFQTNKSLPFQRKQSTDCHQLLFKANQSIRKSYQLSGKMAAQSPKRFKDKKPNLNLTSNHIHASQKSFHFDHSFNLFFKNKSIASDNDICVQIKTGDMDGNNNATNVSIDNDISIEPFKNNPKQYTLNNQIKVNQNYPKQVISLVNLEQLTYQHKEYVQELNISKQFEYIKMLGKGKFGEVFMARHIYTGFIFAIKKVSKKQLKQCKMIERFSEQILLHSKLNHPNIVAFYGFFEEKDNICLVLQYLSGGTLFDYQTDVGILSVKEAVSFLREVIDALIYLHQKYIVHRDIKPENIVISSTGMAKLCDFGWSTQVKEARTTFCGTLDYASPEIIERKQYDWSVDVWCVGVLTYQMFVGRSPFQNSDRQQVIQGILNVDKMALPFIETVPPQARQLIEAVLQKNPLHRPKIAELLDFPLFMESGRKTKRPKQ